MRLRLVLFFRESRAGFNLFLNPLEDEAGAGAGLQEVDLVVGGAVVVEFQGLKNLLLCPARSIPGKRRGRRFYGVSSIESPYD